METTESLLLSRLNNPVVWKRIAEIAQIKSPTPEKVAAWMAGIDFSVGLDGRVTHPTKDGLSDVKA